MKDIYNTDRWPSDSGGGMFEPSVGILIALGIQIFANASLLLNDCSTIEKYRIPFFKWFLVVVVCKLLFQMSMGLVYTFHEHLRENACRTMEHIYTYAIFNIDLAQCAVLSFVAYPPVLDKTVFCVVNQLSFVMIGSLSHFITTDETVFLLLGISGAVVCVSFLCCQFELSIIFLLYVTSLVLDIWLGESVMIVFQTVLWTGVLGWFSVDRRRNDEVEYTVPPSENGFETIELN